MTATANGTSTPVDTSAGSELLDVPLIEDPEAPPRRDPVNPTFGQPLVAWIEDQPKLRPVADVLTTVAGRVSASPLGPFLRGEWLGHPLHPAATDVPIGFWTSATVLDLLAGRRSRPVATMLIGLGVLSTVPTIAAGLADSATLDDRSRRVASAHAAGNVAATLLYALSWRARRHRHHLRGVALGLAGATAASVAGFLGGHLAFGDSAGD